MSKKRHAYLSFGNVGVFEGEVKLRWPEEVHSCMSQPPDTIRAIFIEFEDFDDVSQLDELARVIETLVAVERVHFYHGNWRENLLYGDGEDERASALERVFRTSGQLPQLKELVFEFPYSPLPFAMINAALDQPIHQLRRLYFDFDTIQEPELAAMPGLLSQHCTLKELIWMPYRFVPSSCRFPTQAVLPSLSNLRCLRMPLHEMSDVAMSTICSSSVRELILDCERDGLDWELVAGSSATLCEALKDNKTLQTIEYECFIDGIGLFFDVIANNKGLREIHLVGCLARPNYLELSSALQNNSTLKTLNMVDLWGFAADNEKYSFAQTMKSNYVLEEFSLSYKGCQEGDFITLTNPFPVIQSYLLLNKAGRKRFVEEGDSIPLEEWAEALAQCAGDQLCLFELIRLNPSLCRYLSTKLCKQCCKAFGVNGKLGAQLLQQQAATQIAELQRKLQEKEAENDALCNENDTLRNEMDALRNENSLLVQGQATRVSVDGAAGGSHTTVAIAPFADSTEDSSTSLKRSPDALLSTSERPNKRPASEGI